MPFLSPQRYSATRNSNHNYNHGRRRFLSAQNRELTTGNSGSSNNNTSPSSSDCGVSERLHPSKRRSFDAVVSSSSFSPAPISSTSPYHTRISFEGRPLIAICSMFKQLPHPYLSCLPYNLPHVYNVVLCAAPASSFAPNLHPYRSAFLQPCEYHVRHFLPMPNFSSTAYITWYWAL